MFEVAFKFAVVFTAVAVGYCLGVMINTKDDKRRMAKAYYEGYRRGMERK